jgi:hypothetical protein
MEPFGYGVALKRACWMVCHGLRRCWREDHVPEIVHYEVFVVSFLGLGDSGAKIMSQNSSIVRLLVSFVLSVLVVVLLVAAAVSVTVGVLCWCTVGALTLSSCTCSGCPCLSNGPNCRQEYACTLCKSEGPWLIVISNYLQSVHISQRSFPSTSPVILAACAVAHSQTSIYAASYDHLGPESKAQTRRSCVVCVYV